MLIERASIAKAMMPTAVPNLFLVPASVDLAAAELELVDMPRREFRLRDALDVLDGAVRLCADRLPAGSGPPDH